MNEKHVFVIKNQIGQYLDKQDGWQSGKDANALFRVDYYDQALNTLIEINAKEISLRGKIIEVPLDEKKRPIVDVSEQAIALDQIHAHPTVTQEAESVSESESEENDEEKGLSQEDILE